MRRVTNYKSDVSKIFDSMMKNLYKPDWKYVFHDVGFLKMFWNKLSMLQRTRLKLLINKGKFEIVNCGISMHDSALPLVGDILTHFMNGRRWCETELDYTPKTAWFVDTFGFNKVNARLMEEMGYENIVLNRINYLEKKQRIVDDRLMFTWKTKNKSKGIRAAILNHHYNGSDFASVNEKWVFDDPMSGYFNLFQKHVQMIDSYHRLKQVQNTNFVFDLYGDDFSHMDFDATIGSYEKLIAFNRYNPLRSQGFKVNFATATEYFEDFSNYSSKKVKSENPNFIPYIDKPAEYWVGFYSTRPKLKLDIRKTLNSYYSVQNLLSVGYLQDIKMGNSPSYQIKNGGRIEYIENMIGILLHHDAITATSMSFVIADYSKKIKKTSSEIGALLKSSDYMNDFFKRQTGQDISKFFDFFLCNWQECGTCLLNKFKKENSPLIVLYNPLFKRLLTDTIMVPDNNIMLFDMKGAQIPNYIHCFVVYKTGPCRMIYQTEMKTSELKMFKLRQWNNRMDYIINSQKLEGCKQFTLEDRVILRVNCTESPQEVVLKEIESGLEYNLNVSLKEYLTKDSGPYIFQPSFGFRQSPRPIPNNEIISIEYIESPVALEIRFVYGTNWQILRYLKNTGLNDEEGITLEVEVFMKNEGFKSDNRIYSGREVVIEFKSNFSSNNDFFFSQNGLESQTAPLPNFKRFVNDFYDDYGLGKCNF